MNKSERFEVAEVIREMVLSEYPDLTVTNGAEYDVDVSTFLSTGQMTLGFTRSAVECFDIQLTLDMNRRVVIRDALLGRRVVVSEVSQIFKSVGDIKDYIRNFDFDTEIICDADLEALERQVA